MTQKNKDALSAFFAKDKKRDSFRKTIEDYVIWQLAALPDEALADTTADEIIKGIFDMKKICQTVISEAQKQKSGSSAAQNLSLWLSSMRKIVQRCSKAARRMNSPPVSSTMK